MKQIFHKISSFFMAIVVLFSTMSFTIDMHFCGETLVDTSIFHKAETCGMEMEKEAPSSNCSIVKKNCCTDKQLVVDGQDELKTSFKNLSFDQQLFVSSFIYSHINLFEGLEENVISYRDYKPPLVIRQIFKLDESFLI